MTASIRFQKRRPGRDRPLKDGEPVEERFNDLLAEGFLLDKGTNGDILVVTLAPNETAVIPHGLRTTPKFRMILRQTGNGVLEDVNEEWNEKTVGFVNNSADTLVLTIKLFRG